MTFCECEPPGEDNGWKTSVCLSCQLAAVERWKSSREPEPSRNELP